MVEYPEWFANVIHVLKKDGKVRVCVDFQDLNKVSLKDDFPLPHINMLVDSTTGHSMLSFMDGFSRYNQILMALEDMEKTSFITEWGTYYYRVMTFGLKNVGATYQRATTTIFHDMMHQDVECTFGVTYGKLLGYMVSERGIEADPDKIRVILDMLASRTEREIRGFLGRLQKSQPTRIKKYLLSPPVLVPPTPGHPLLLYLSVSDIALGCMLAQLDDSGEERAIYYLSKRMLDYETRYKSIRGSIVADHLASLSGSYGKAIDDDFPDEDITTMTSLSGWCMHFDGAANHSRYGIGVLLISPRGDHIPRSYEACILGLEIVLELGIRQMKVFSDSNMVLRQIQGKWKTRDVKLRPYHEYLELLVGRFDDLRYTHLPRV
ncbi:hypothetical protein AAG906_020697 [Vitis piasezkii]